MTTPMIIILNGVSSSGKTTIAKNLQKIMSESILHMSVDSYLKRLPGHHQIDNAGEADLKVGFSAISSFHQLIADTAQNSNHMIVDHVVGEKKDWVEECRQLFSKYDVVWVGVFCSLHELEKRELKRLDRNPDLNHVRRQYESIHQGMQYDLKLDTTHVSAEDCASQVKSLLFSKVGAGC